MSKKTAAADVDDLIGGDAPAEAKSSAKAKKAKPAAATAEPAKKAKPAAAKKAEAPAAKPAKKAKPAAAAKKASADAGGAGTGSTSPIRLALLKVKKATSYSDFSEANGFDIRSVRRTARALRDAGEINLVKEGVVVYISPAV